MKLNIIIAIWMIFLTTVAYVSAGLVQELNTELTECRTRIERCQSKTDYYRRESYRRAVFIEAVAWREWVVAQNLGSE